ncbi:hypothetical protein [Candidatus Entotheonella palauensis]|nr:hypothetical protein [Candidatus Entotheonella palauensis]
MKRWLVLWFSLLAVSVGAAADTSEKLIQGEIRVQASMAHHLSKDDRLIIKLYYPSDGIERDPKFQILSDFTLPLTFRIAPTIDMSGRTKWPSYIVEAFTDKDNDVLSVAPGELTARTPELVRLGTTGVVLELNALRQ